MPRPHGDGGHVRGTARPGLPSPAASLARPSPPKLLQHLPSGFRRSKGTARPGCGAGTQSGPPPAPVNKVLSAHGHTRAFTRHCFCAAEAKWSCWDGDRLARGKRLPQGSPLQGEGEGGCRAERRTDRDRVRKARCVCQTGRKSLGTQKDGKRYLCNSRHTPLSHRHPKRRRRTEHTHLRSRRVGRHAFTEHPLHAGPFPGTRGTGWEGTGRALLAASR